jgi:hypothetical protein
VSDTEKNREKEGRGTENDEESKGKKILRVLKNTAKNSLNVEQKEKRKRG